MRVTVWLAIAVALSARVAHAQEAEAETLFREGKRLMKEGNFAAACDKLEASERLDPSAGTELNLADCREKNGQLATAWALFVKAAATAKHSDGDKKREAEARRRADALESQLVHLRVIVADDAKVDGLEIKRNGERIDPELWNQRIPVDSATYDIVATAPGYESFETTVKVGARDKKVEIPQLDRAKHVKAKPKRDEREDDDRPAPVAAAGMTGARKASLALAIGGVVLIGAGAGLGYHAKDLENQSDQLCPDVKCKSPMGVSLNQDAKKYGLYANIGFVAGGAAAATAIVLWFVGAPHATEHVAIVPRGDGATFVVGGRF